MMDYVDDTHAWWPRSVVIIRFLIADVQLRGWSVIERHQCSLSLSLGRRSFYTWLGRRWNLKVPTTYRISKQSPNCLDDAVAAVVMGHRSTAGPKLPA